MQIEKKLYLKLKFVKSNISEIQRHCARQEGKS